MLIIDIGYFVAGWTVTVTAPVITRFRPSYMKFPHSFCFSNSQTLTESDGRMRTNLHLIVWLLIFCAAASSQGAPADAFLPDSISVSDSLWLDSLATHSGEAVVCAITIVNPDSLNGIDLPLRYDDPDFRIDSVSFAGSRVEGVFSLLGYDLDTVEATLHIHALQMSGTSLVPGRGLLARLFIHVPDEYPTRLVTIDSTFIQPISHLTFVNRDNASFTPQFRPGRINNTYSPALNDSLWLDTAEVTAGQAVTIAVHARNEQPQSSIKIPLTYHSDNLLFDSLSVAGTRASGAVLQDALVNDAAKEVLLTLGFAESTLLPIGTGPVAMLHFSSLPGGTSTAVTLDTTTISAIRLHFQLGTIFDHVKSYPDFVPGLVKLGPPSDAEDGGEHVPTLFSLEQNQPNPFNPTTTIAFALPKAAAVTLEVYNVLGQNVRTLLNDRLPAGIHHVVFDGRDGQNGELASGVYLYRIKTDTHSETKKMILMK